MKKILILISALCLFLSACSGRSAGLSGQGQSALEAVGFRDKGYPITKEKLTFTAMVPVSQSPVAEGKNAADYENLTNLRVQWQYYQSPDIPQSIEILLASGAELPDLFLMAELPNTIADAYINQGLFRPVEALLSEYAPNLRAAMADLPEAKKLCTAADGHMYAVPSILRQEAERLGPLPVIRREWAEQLGVQLPETPEELYTYLQAVKNGDPNHNGQQDEIPLLLCWNDMPPNFLFGAWDTCSAYTGGDAPYAGGPFFVRDNQAVASNMRPGYAEAVNYLHRLYAEGLINDNAFSGSADEILPKGRDWLPAGLTTAHYLSELAESFDAAANTYAYLLPLEGAGGDRHLFDTLYGIFPDNYISSEAEYPEAIMRWMDGTAAPEISLWWVSGSLNMNYKRRDGKYELSRVPDTGLPGYMEIAKRRPYPVLGLSDSWLSKNYRPTLKPELSRKNAVSQSLPWADMLTIGHLRYTVEERQKLDAILPQIIAYSRQKESEWIINGGIDGEWDAHLRRLKNMGIKEVLTIMQTACERWNAIQ